MNAAVVVVALAALCSGRTGTGDPAEIFRDKDPENDLVLHGQLRLRAAMFNNLDLDRGTFHPLFVSADDDAPVFGSDVRARVSPSFFLGDELRLFLDVDAVTASAGQAPNGVPSLLSSSPLAASFLDVRAAGVDWLLPVGVLSIGRMPSHFALGIAANDGADIDDDFGDHADRIALVLPLFGHLVAGAFDALDPRANAQQIGEQAVSVGLMKWRAPWEVELYRNADRAVFDYGAAFSYEWEAKSAPGPWQQLFALRGIREQYDPFSVRRDAHLAVVDAWARLVVGDVRVESEAFVGDLFIANPSTIPGVVVRDPIVGNPAAGAVVVDWRTFKDASDAGGGFAHALFEVGAASADPAPGFPLATPQSAFSGAQPGDVFGAQVDLKHGGDSRFDSARIHPLHRIDLILWRTLLGGVSEAAYARANFAASPTSWLRLDGNVVYSHAISVASTPGNAAPLGLELDVGAEAALPFLGDGASARVDAGNLVPLGGLGVRGGPSTSPSSWGQMMLVRLGYAL